jgi:ACS family hexuronate transporter-like MFS transporter
LDDLCFIIFATTVNYLDRQVLSLLKPTLEVEFGWSNSDYANIASVFQFVYAICLLFAGRFVDKVGTDGVWLGYYYLVIRSGYSCVFCSVGTAAATFLGWFGVAAVPVSIAGFMISRAILGLGEAGNFPAAIKATAEYFPKKKDPLPQAFLIQVRM